MDIATILGVVLAIGCIVGGQALEGGHIGSILQLTAALIVFGGTVGAVLVMFPMPHVIRAAKDVVRIVKPPRVDGARLIETLGAFAHKARREGIVALENEAASVGDPFFEKALSLAVDGVSSKAIREAMEVELRTFEEEGEVASKVFEAAGGYAPTVGILGAVLGLIHVMENLSDPSKLGSGIAVAFVATVYGVGSANLLFLPAAGKLKSCLAHEVAMKELVLEGVCAIADGENPRLIEQKLQGFLAGHARKPAEGAPGQEQAKAA